MKNITVPSDQKIRLVVVEPCEDYPNAVKILQSQHDDIEIGAIYVWDELTDPDLCLELQVVGIMMSEDD